MFERTIDDIVDTLSGVGGSTRKCSVLIGAGCSRSAGIPLASEIVQEIRVRYRAAYSRAVAKDYPNCMAALDVGVRRDLIGTYIDQAKINWAHIALAQILDKGHADRVLTTNFDPLVSRACALANVFPAVYDFAASHVFKPDQVSKQAIFHLHGQRDGFVLLNTATEVKNHKKHLGPVVEDSSRGRVWIVVGYSGENDPVFDLLADITRFDYGLYWIGRTALPPKHVSERLLTPEKGAYFLGNWDADDFFVALARKLGCFPPNFLRQPFSYLKAILARLSDYKALNEDGRFDVTASIRRHLDLIIAKDESSVSAEYHFLADEYDEVVTLLNRGRIDQLSTRNRHLLAWAFIMQGNQFHDLAKKQDSEKVYKEAIAKFRRATKISGDLYEAYFNWGNVLFDLSLRQRKGALEVIDRKSERLLQSAVAKYRSAISLYPNAAEVHNNCANALTDLARVAPIEDEVRILKDALKHYKRAAADTETPAVIHCNWGKALHKLARKTRSVKTFMESFEKFRLAASFDPDHYSTFLSWANALSDLARKKKSRELYTQAFTKYRRATEILPNDAAACWNWAGDLTALAGLTTGSQKKKLLKEAKAKYRIAKSGRLAV